MWGSVEPKPYLNCTACALSQREKGFSCRSTNRLHHCEIASLCSQFNRDDDAYKLSESASYNSLLLKSMTLGEVRVVKEILRGAALFFYQFLNENFVLPIQCFIKCFSCNCSSKPSIALAASGRVLLFSSIVCVRRMSSARLRPMYTPCRGMISNDRLINPRRAQLLSVCTPWMRPSSALTPTAVN